MAERRVCYMLEDAAPFSIHADGLLIQAVTRKSEVPVTVEIEGVSRRMLLQFQAAIEQLTQYLDTKKVGDRVTLSVTRNGRHISVGVTLGNFQAQPSATP